MRKGIRGVVATTILGASLLATPALALPAVQPTPSPAPAAAVPQASPAPSQPAGSLAQAPSAAPATNRHNYQNNTSISIDQNKLQGTLPGYLSRITLEFALDGQVLCREEQELAAPGSSPTQQLRDKKLETCSRKLKELGIQTTSVRVLAGSDTLAKGSATLASDGTLSSEGVLVAVASDPASRGREGGLGLEKGKKKPADSQARSGGKSAKKREEKEERELPKTATNYTESGLAAAGAAVVGMAALLFFFRFRQRRMMKG